MISVIMPIYNTAEYLSKSIESVIRQSYSEWELILINDGSTDNSEQVCLEFKTSDDRIHYFKQKNKGVSAARNNGLKQAKGEYVYFMDSDDELLEGCFEEVSRAAADCPDLMYFDMEAIDSSGEVHNLFPNFKARDCKFISIDDRTNFITKHYFNQELIYFPCNKIYKREILVSNNIEFNCHMTVGEDLMFTTKYLLYANSVRGIEKKLYKYNIRVNSAMGQNGQKLHINSYVRGLYDIYLCRNNVNLSKSAFRDIFMQAIYDQYGKRMNNEHLHEYVRKVSDKLFLWNNTIYFVLRPWKLKCLYGEDKWLDMWKLLILVSSYCIA